MLLSFNVDFHDLLELLKLLSNPLKLLLTLNNNLLLLEPSPMCEKY